MFPYDLYLMHKMLPKYWAARLYQLNSKLMLSFLSRIEENGQFFNANDAKTFVEAHEFEWINYDIQYQPQNKLENI